MTKLEEALNDKKNKIIAYTDQFGQGKTTSILKLKEEVEKREGNNKEFIIYESFYYEWVGNNKIHFIFEILNKMGLSKSMKLSENKEKNWFKGLTQWFHGIEVTLKTPFFDVKTSFKRPKKENNYILDTLIKFKSQADYLIEFKKSVEEYLKEENKEIVLVVDDLDRINPHSAIEIIEIAKHFFDISNFQIILIFDKECMNEIYEKTIGNRNGEMYLNKYINVWVDHSRPKLNDVFKINSELIQQKIETTFEKTLSIRKIIDNDFSNFIKKLQWNKPIEEWTESFIEMAIFLWVIASNNPRHIIVNKNSYYRFLNRRENELIQLFEYPNELKLDIKTHDIIFTTFTQKNINNLLYYIDNQKIEPYQNIDEWILILCILNDIDQ